MMLTAKQPSVYGYQSVHDLPTPPSASRPSPPLAHPEPSHRKPPSLRRSQSPVTQPMSAPHRGLPPPAAMTLPHQQQPPPPPQQQPQPQQHQHQHHHSAGVNHPHSQYHHHQHQPPHQPPPPPPQNHPAAPLSNHPAAPLPNHPGASLSNHPVVAPLPNHPAPPPQNHSPGTQSWPSLPPPPSQWQGAEESMRSWLQTRAEEEKTKQEEEKTRQEGLRLEQRRIEAEILRSSLGGGIPPPMVPLVFAGMGGGGMLSQAALEWAQQFIPPSHNNHLQLMAPQGAVTSQSQRDQTGQGHSQYGTPAAQGSGQAAGAYTPQSGSPNRTRAPSTTGAINHPIAQGTNHPNHPNHPNLNTNFQVGGGNTQAAHQAYSQLSNHSAQQDPSPSIYFHHWQPPTSQAGGSSNRPGSPSGDGPKKRKAAGEQQTRSPPPFASSSSSNTTGHNTKGHKRQRSDVSWYRPSYGAQDRTEESDSAVREKSPPSSSRERARSEAGKHSVPSLLSADPAEPVPTAQESSSDPRLQPGQPGSSVQYHGGGESPVPRTSSPSESDPPPQNRSSQRG